MFTTYVQENIHQFIKFLIYSIFITSLRKSFIFIQTRNIWIHYHNARHQSAAPYAS